MKLTVATMNLRMQNASDGELAFEFRREAIAAKLREARPDMIGFQEMLEEMRDWLEAALPEYHFVGVSRGAHFDGECNAIAYLRDTMLLHETRTFWLSPTPSVPGSRYEPQSPCPRICTCALLRHKPSGTLVRLFNTHLDHVAEYAMEMGLGQVLAAAKAAQAEQRLPLFVTGDMNFTPGSRPYGQIEACGFVDLTAESGGTFHDFERCTPGKIDYILAERENPFAELSLEKWHRGSTLLSDHDALAVTWTFEP